MPWEDKVNTANNINQRLFCVIKFGGKCHLSNLQLKCRTKYDGKAAISTYKPGAFLLQVSKKDSRKLSVILSEERLGFMNGQPFLHPMYIGLVTF